MTVKIDGNEIGAPPVSRELAAGSHELVFIHGGAPVDVRRVEIEAGGIVDVTAPHVAATRGRAFVGERSRLLPGLLVAGGLVAAAAGGVLLYYG